MDQREQQLNVNDMSPQEILRAAESLDVPFSCKPPSKNNRISEALGEQMKGIQSMSSFYSQWQLYCETLAAHMDTWSENNKLPPLMSFLIYVVEEYITEKNIASAPAALTTKERASFFRYADRKRDSFLGSPTAVRTRFPAQYLTPIDKASRELFSGELLTSTTYRLAVERRGSKREITTLLSIDFDDLGENVQIAGRQKLTPYDREVHDAIVTLYIDGGNEYITPQMIYQTMTGRKSARLMPKQAVAIRESINKCMYSRVTIDASEEARAYGFDEFRYDGNLVPSERVIATINGETMECIHLLRQPVLYEYASLKNQIGRVDIKLLDTPINKTEEILMLQGYLQRRILSMKGSNLSRNILFDTVYKYLDISAASDGALRLKKSKVRGQIRSILDYWKSERFITDFSENKRGAEYYSVTIDIA